MPAATGQRGSWEADEGGKTSSSGGSIGGGSSGHRKVGGSQDKVAVVLASAGLDPIELQQQRPEEYSRLTLPLAQVLAQLHTTRVAKAVGTLTVQPAEMMARICFLAYEVGLSPGDLRQIVQRYSDSLRFDLESGRGLLAWLRLQGVSTSQLRLASRCFPKIWSADVSRLQRNKQHLHQQLAVTDSQWAEAFAAQPQAAWAAPEVVDGVVAWLEAEPLGFSRPEVAQQWRSAPLLFAIPVATLQRNLQHRSEAAGAAGARSSRAAWQLGGRRGREKQQQRRQQQKWGQQR